MADPTPPPGFEPLTPPTASTTPPPPPGFVPLAAPGVLESVGRGFVEGGTFGYDDRLGMSKERREASRKANPWAHFFGELVGGAAPMAAAALLPTGVGQAAAGARAATLLGRGAGLARAALVPGEISTLGQAGGQGLKLGTVYGGLSGSGHADVQDTDTLGQALTKRATGALAGAGEGALMGPVMGVAGHGAYRGAQWFGGLKALADEETAGLGQGALRTAERRFERDRITPQTMIDQILTEFPDATQAVPGGSGAPLARRFWGDIGNKQPITAQQVETAVRMSMAGDSPADISTALRTANGGQGPGETAVKTLLDELAERHLGPLNMVDRAAMVRKGSGDNTQMTMRAAAATPGEHVGIARENLLERQVEAGPRMQDMFARTLGSPDLEAVAKQHSDTLKNTADLLYGDAKASEQPFDLNPIFNRWQARFENKNGPIPRGVKSVLDDMRTVQPVVDQEGNLARQPPGGIFNKAPPMDLEGFKMARQGLSDAIDREFVQTATGPKMTNLGAELSKLKAELTAEVGKTNPKWLEANGVYREGKAAEDAMKAGADMTLRLNSKNRANLTEFTGAEADAAKAASQLRAAHNAITGAPRREATAAELASATPQQRAGVAYAQARVDAANARQELFKVGLVRALNDMIANKGDTHDLARQLLLPGAKQMLTRVLGKDADQFFKLVRAEQAMHRTYQSQFGSQTTPLREHIDELNFAPRFEASWHNLGLGKVMQLAQEYAARHLNASRNTKLMELYMETDPLKQLEALRSMQTLHTARSNAGNLVGKPAIGLGAGVLPDALIGMETAPSPAQPLKPYRP